MFNQPGFDISKVLALTDDSTLGDIVKIVRAYPHAFSGYNFIHFALNSWQKSTGELDERGRFERMLVKYLALTWQISAASPNASCIDPQTGFYQLTFANFVVTSNLIAEVVKLYLHYAIPPEMRVGNKTFIAELANAVQKDETHLFLSENLDLAVEVIGSISMAGPFGPYQYWAIINAIFAGDLLQNPISTLWTTADAYGIVEDWGEPINTLKTPQQANNLRARTLFLLIEWLKQLASSKEKTDIDAVDNIIQSLSNAGHSRIIPILTRGIPLNSANPFSSLSKLSPMLARFIEQYGDIRRSDLQVFFSLLQLEIANHCMLTPET